MKNEYLFNTEKHKEEISSLVREDVSLEVIEIDDTDLWIAVFSVENNDEVAAEKLSSINCEIGRFSPRVLTCESSDFYTRELYPASIELERKLRKALYIAASVLGDEKNEKKFNDLEQMSLSNLFALLFYDQKFIELTKKGVGKKAHFSKQEIIDEIAEVKETVLWDDLFKGDEVPTLRENFKNVQEYRNDIMHAHNIETDRYHEAKQLMLKVIDELDVAIEVLVDNSEQKTPEQKQITDERISDAYEGLMRNIDASMNAFHNIVAMVTETLSPVTHELTESMKRTMSGFDTSAILQISENIKQITAPFEALKVNLNGLTQISEVVQTVIYSIEPVVGLQDMIDEQQRMLSVFSRDYLLDKKEELEENSSEKEFDDGGNENGKNNDDQ